MTLTRDEIARAAFQLSPEEREALVQDLLLGLAPEDREAMEAVWLVESNRRFDAYVSGATPGHTFDSVIDELKARIPR